MSEDRDGIALPCNEVWEFLRQLPADCPETKLYGVVDDLTNMLAHVTLHRDWQRGSLHGVQRLVIRKKMRLYFGHVFPHKGKVMPDAKKERMVARETEALAELRKLSITAHIVNSVSYQLSQLRRLTADFVKTAPYDDLAMKFLKHIWNADLKKEAKDIMEDANFDTEAHRKGDF
jgi:hypothetical protein